MNRWLLLLGAVLSEVAATLSLRGAVDRPVLFVVVGIGYLASFTLLAAVLRSGMTLSVAYGVWSALGVALTALLSAVLFGEPLTVLMMVGLVLVIAGVVLVETGQHHPPQGTTPEAPQAESGAH
jgi:small multidrug resistance pump